METALVKILSRIDAHNLPVVPELLLDLMDKIARQEVNLDTLAQIIAQDASLTASILTAANTTVYRQWGEVTELKKVLVILGLNTVKTLIITKSIQQFFARLPAAQQAQVEIIWQRSLTCAYLAKSLAQLMAYDFPDEVYLAGLLHRLGQLVLLQCYPQQYPDFLTRYAAYEHAHQEALLFDTAHPDIGAHIISTWHLKSFIADAIRQQYQTADHLGDSPVVVKIVNLASQLSSLAPHNQYSVFEQARQLFGFTPSLLEAMLEEVKPVVDKLSAEFGLQFGKQQGQTHSLTTEAHRATVQNNLAVHIKQLALNAALQEPLAQVDELAKLVQLLHRDMCTLFGFPTLIFFIYRPETHSLDFVPSKQQTESAWETLNLTLKSNTSLVARTWHKQRILHSFNLDKQAAENQQDLQLCQRLHAEDILTIPLVHQQKTLAVIVTGLKRMEVKRIKLNLKFISLFVDEVAKILHNLGLAAQKELHNIAEVRANYAAYARKLGHEINNPLSIINNYLYLLSLKLNPEQAEEIKIIQEEIDRVSNISLSLSDFSLDNTKHDNDWVDLNQLIADLIRLFEAGIFKMHNIKVTLALDTALNKLPTNKNKLKQVLTNLLKNAVEALPSGGEIVITTKAQIIQQQKTYVQIQIQDSGPGLPEMLLPKLFMPIKSTKGKYHAGLGLTIAKSLVDELKGQLRCESKPGKTIFYIDIPKEI